MPDGAPMFNAAMIDHNEPDEPTPKVVKLSQFRGQRRFAAPVAAGGHRSCLPPATPMDAIDHAIASLRRGDLVEWELELIRTRYLAEVERRSGNPKRTR